MRKLRIAAKPFSVNGIKEYLTEKLGELEIKQIGVEESDPNIFEVWIELENRRTSEIDKIIKDFAKRYINHLSELAVTDPRGRKPYKVYHR